MVDMKHLVFVIMIFFAAHVPVQGQMLTANGKPDLYPAREFNPYGLSTDKPNIFSKEDMQHRSFAAPVFLFDLRAPSTIKPAQLAGDFYYTHCYGFFCKMEWVTEHKWHIPLSLRLGSYHYERRLEGEE